MTTLEVGLQAKCCVLQSLVVARMPVKEIQVRKNFSKFQSVLICIFTGGPLVRTSGDGVTVGQNYELIGKWHWPLTTIQRI